MASFTPFKPLSKSDVAEVLGVSIRTIENWVNDGALPAPVKLGNRVYWHPDNFYAWLDARLSVEAGVLVGNEDAVTSPKNTRLIRTSDPAKEELGMLRRRNQAELEALVD